MFLCDILEVVCTIIKITILRGFFDLFTSKILGSRAANWLQKCTYCINCFCFHTDFSPPFLTLYTFHLLYQLVVLVMGGSSLFLKTLTCSSLCERVSKYFILKIYIMLITVSYLPPTIWVLKKCFVRTSKSCCRSCQKRWIILNVRTSNFFPSASCQTAAWAREANSYWTVLGLILKYYTSS